ncbi:AbgT family transporter [Nesterenkonia sedimenti]|nr:AbgT family transporter [Nesterenkonia sedimenti]
MAAHDQTTDDSRPGQDPPEERQGMIVRALNGVERIGNYLPHPFWLFVILAGVVVVLSSVLNAMGVGAEHPAPEEGEDSWVGVESLLTAEGLQVMVTGAVDNFVNFPPLGLIITVMLGVAVAEGSGLISATIRVAVSRVSKRWLTFTVALAGVTGSVASDAIYIILIPLAAAAFKAVGRSAVLGAIVAFGSASAGYNASLVITASDPLFAGISTSAAQLIDEDYVVSPIANYFFAAASAVVLAAVVTLVTELLLVKVTAKMRSEEDKEGGAATAVLRAGRSEETQGAGTEGASAAIEDNEDLLSYTKEEVRALWKTGLSLVIFLGVFFAALFIPGSPFDGGGAGALESPLVTDVAVPISLAFLVIGLTYGISVGSIKRAQDVPMVMARSLKELTGVIVIFFAAAQFIAYFNWTNMGTVLAINGAETLERWDLPPFVLFGSVVLLVALFNFFITSGSAQYTLMAPVLVPMLMLIGVNPEVTQMLFRMGDSPTNIITPMSPYFALVLGYLQRYYPRAGVGTMISLTLPLALTMLVTWFLFFMVWYAFGLPLGPGVPIR